MHEFKCIADSQDSILHRVFSIHLNDVLAGRRISLFGIGIVSQELTRALLNNGIDVDSYVVTNKKNNNFNGKLVYSIEEYKNIKKVNILVIAVSSNEDEVYGNLIEYGIIKDNILKINYDLSLGAAIAEPTQVTQLTLKTYPKNYYLKKLNDDNEIIEFVLKNLEDKKSREILTQKINLLLNWDSVSILGKFLHDYSEPVLKFGNKPIFGLFPESYFYFNNEFISNELMRSFVDVGAYDGCSVEQYLNFCNLNNIHDFAAYCFEPDPYNFLSLQKKFEYNKNIKLFNKGLWSSAEFLKFKTSDSFNLKSSSCIHPLGEISVEVVDFDSLKIKDITLFKADPPGLDVAINVLEGAIESIKKYRPLMIFPAYHSFEAIYMMPFKMMSTLPEYKFYLRHLSWSIGETDCFAVPK